MRYVTYRALKATFSHNIRENYISFHETFHHHHQHHNNNKHSRFARKPIFRFSRNDARRIKIINTNPMKMQLRRVNPQQQ